MGSQKAQVMPFKIMVEIGNPMVFSENPQIFDGQQQPLYKMSAQRHNNHHMDRAIEFTEELFCRLLSIDREESVKSFISDYPICGLAYCGSPFMVDLPEFATFDTYAHEIIRQIKTFKSINTFYSAYINYNQHRLQHDRKTMQEIYKAYYPILKKETVSWQTYSDFYEWLYPSHNNEECDGVFENDDYEEASEEEEGCERIEVEGQGCLFPDLSSEPTDEAEGIQARTDNEPSALVNYILDDFKHFLFRLSKDNSMIQSPDGLSITCYCKTFVSAMYVMMSVSAFNQDIYLQCAHPRCSTYFKLDKSHRQSLCPKHIAPRQRKRKNAKEKERLEIEEANGYIAK